VYLNVRKAAYISKGFTLIELAVVLVIVGVLLGSFIGTLSSRISVTKISDTRDELEKIKQSMMAYAFVNGSLPCPDCDKVPCTGGIIRDGIEDYNGVDKLCSENQGMGNVPWVTLGLGSADSWNNRYRYAVHNVYADVSAPFDLDSPAGYATIEEPNFVADVTGDDSHSLAERVVAIIFSHGSNGYGATSVNNQARPAIPAANRDERENTDDTDAIYYMRPASDVNAAIAGGEFDDIVIWISEYELKAKMVEAGKLP